MNAIIFIEGGIIQSVTTCKCSAQAGLIYVEMANEHGADLEEEDIEEMSHDAWSVADVIRKVDKALEFNGKELKWFDADHVKKVK